MNLKEFVFLVLLSVGLTLGVLTCGVGTGFAACEAEQAALQQAEAARNAAEQNFQNANNAVHNAQAAVAAAAAAVNQIAAGLGASGSLDAQGSGGFGRSPSNPHFFENPAYKDAMQNLQNAKDDLAAAEGDQDMAADNRQNAENAYNDAVAALKKCKNLEEEATAAEREQIEKETKPAERVATVTPSSHASSALAVVDPGKLLDELKALTSKAKQLAEEQEDVSGRFFATYGNVGGFQAVDGGLLADVHFSKGHVVSDPQLLVFKNEGDKPLELTVGLKLPPGVKAEGHSEVSDALADSYGHAQGGTSSFGSPITSVPAKIDGQSLVATIPPQSTAVMALTLERTEPVKSAQTISCPATYSVSSPEGVKILTK